MINLTITSEQLHTVLSWGLVQADVHFYSVELYALASHFQTVTRYGQNQNVYISPVTILRTEHI